ncbi:MAG: glutaredoxin 3 [Bdellovibrionota bacterium]
MAKITLYSADWCPFCVRAKRLLEGKGVAFDEVNVDKQPGKREEMVAKTGYKTIPMIFINDKFIGGFSELSALEAKGELDSMIKQ